MLKLSLAMLMGLTVWSATAAQPVGERLSDADLDAERGGFSLPDGQQLNFTASVSSYLDGALVLQSRVTWTDSGPVASHVAADGAPLDADALAGLTAAGVDVHSLTGAAFVSADGQTVFLHQAGDQAIANVILNSASNRDLRQEATVALDLPGFDGRQTVMREALAARALADDIRLGLRP